MQSLKKIAIGVLSCVFMLTTVSLAYAEDSAPVSEETTVIETVSELVSPEIFVEAPELVVEAAPAADGQADVYITKAGSITSGSNGDAVTYTINYGNKGSANAFDVKIMEEFPAEVNANLAGQGWTNVGGAIREISFGSMPAGFTGVITITGIIQNGVTFPEDGTNFVNSVAITTTSSELSNDNNTAFWEIRAYSIIPVSTGVANLYIQKYANIAGGINGTPITYKIVYGNSGTALATGVKIMEEFPAEVNANLAGQGWTNVGGNIREKVIGNVPEGIAVQFEITGTIQNGVTFPEDGTNFVNSVMIMSSSVDSDSADNNAFVEVKAYSTPVVPPVCTVNCGNGNPGNAGGGGGAGGYIPTTPTAPTTPTTPVTPTTPSEPGIKEPMIPLLPALVSPFGELLDTGPDVDSTTDATVAVGFPSTGAEMTAQQVIPVRVVTMIMIMLVLGGSIAYRKRD